MFFPGRGATIYYRPSALSSKRSIAAVNDTSNPIDKKGDIPQDLNVGTLGILHPTVLQNFEIGYPCSSLELNLDPFKKEIVHVWEDEE